MNTTNSVLLIALAVTSVCLLVFIHRRRRAFITLTDCVETLKEYAPRHPLGNPEALEVFDRAVELFRSYFISPRRFGFADIGEFHKKAVELLTSSLAHAVREKDRAIKYGARHRKSEWERAQSINFIDECSAAVVDREEKLRILISRMPASSSTSPSLQSDDKKLIPNHS